MDIISYQAIWEMLAKDWEATFSSEVVRRHTPEKETSLLECVSCGLHFFYPAVPGDEEFYGELTSGTRYEYIPWKWEFEWTGSRLTSSMAVLDVGCGRGDFLKRIRPFVGKAAGLERNPSAVEHARGMGLDVTTEDLEGFASRNARSFDAVCAFHVVEHLRSPISFLRSLLLCLKEGGFLFLSMPNRLRSGRGPLEPLDSPPHHLSRWSPAQLRKLEDLLPVRLEEMAREPVEMSVPRERLREAVMRASNRIPFAGELLGTWAGRAVVRLVFPGILCRLYRWSGILERMGYCGLSMVARYSVLPEEL